VSLKLYVTFSRNEHPIPSAISPSFSTSFMRHRVYTYSHPSHRHSSEVELDHTFLIVVNAQSIRSSLQMHACMHLSMHACIHACIHKSVHPYKNSTKPHPAHSFFHFPSFETTHTQIRKRTTRYILRFQHPPPFQKDIKSIKLIQLRIRHVIPIQIQINQRRIRKECFRQWLFLFLCLLFPTGCRNVVVLQR